jgi:hypothetical protein
VITQEAIDRCLLSDLGEIEVTPFAKPSDWFGYPDGFERHPARNHPGFVRHLIATFAARSDVPASPVWDPQAGAGTTIREARRLGLMDVSGWDVDPRWRELFKGYQLERPAPDSIGLIVTSPVYPGNHDRGAGATQDLVQAGVRSLQGTGWGGELPPGHLGGAHGIIEWALLARRILEQCLTVLVRGGHLVWIVRDRIVEGRPAQFPDLNANMIARVGFEIPGGYWRRLAPTANEQLRAKGHALRKDPGQQKLIPGEDPPLPTIDREWAIIGRKS